MEFLVLLLIFLITSPSLFVTPSHSQLSLDHYHKSCPPFSQIVQDTIINKQINTPTTAAATLRLFFHDCLLNGCDASILLSSTPFNSAERDADINLSLPGDAFDVVVRAKIALELACPSTVSCADILAVATRDLVSMVGGPYYNVLLGRKDGRVSEASHVEGKLPRPTMSVSEIIKLFASNGFSIQEMVALCGAHTIGFSHCKEFSSGIYNYSEYSQYNPRFAQELQKACAEYQKNPTLSVFNDIMTPNKFDNMYFQNLPKGLGLLRSDHGLYNSYDLPLLPDDSETCVDDLGKALKAKGIELERPNATCDVVYCYCGIRLHTLSCPEAFSVTQKGKLVGDESVKRLERDCLSSSNNVNGFPGLGGCSKCLNSLYKVNKKKTSNSSKSGDRTTKMNNKDCQLMGLTWLLAKNRKAYIHTVSEVFRATMMSKDGSDPRLCALNSDGMPLAVDSSEISGHSSSNTLGAPIYLSMLLVSLLYMLSLLNR